MTLWQFLGCEDDTEWLEAARDLSRNQCPHGGRCSLAPDCVECWIMAIDRVEEVTISDDPR